MSTNNGRAVSLFQPAAKTERFLKVLLTGTFGTGKTRAALSFPGPMAVLDLEGGTALYTGDFDVLRTKEWPTIKAAVEGLAGSHYKSIVIDPITIIWSLLQEAGQTLVDKRNRGEAAIETGKALTYREWGLIKREYNWLITKLINLPMHVVLVTREKDLYEGSGDNMRKVGVQADTEKGTPYLADFVLHMMTEPAKGGGEKFVAIVEKSRSDLLPKGMRLEGYGADVEHGLFNMFLAKVAGVHSQGGQRVVLEDDAAVAERNSAVLESAEQPKAEQQPAQRPQMTAEQRDQAKGIAAYLRELGASDLEISALIGVLTEGKQSHQLKASELASLLMDIKREFKTLADVQKKLEVEPQPGEAVAMASSGELEEI